MRLIRVFTDIIDDGDALGVLSNDFGAEIVVRPNSSLALLNANLAIANSTLVIDGDNNQVDFQFTGPTGIRTCFLPAGTYNASAHDAFFKVLTRTLNNSLGILQTDANLPESGLPSTAVGFSEDIGKEWNYAKAGQVYTQKWINSSRTMTIKDWDRAGTMNATAATSTYNSSVLTPNMTAAGVITEMPVLTSQTEWGRGCSNHYVKVKNMVIATNGGADETNSGFWLGLNNTAIASPFKGNYTAASTNAKYGVVGAWTPGEPTPYVWLIRDGVATADPVENLFYISDDNANNSYIGLFRNFGYLQYIQYADVYWHFLLNAATDDDQAGEDSGNGVAFPDTGSQVGNVAAVRAIYLAAQTAGGAYDSTIPGTGGGATDINNTRIGDTEEVLMGSVPLTTIDITAKYPVMGIMSPDIDDTLDYGGVELKNPRSTLTPWTTAKGNQKVKFHLDDSLTLGFPSPPGQNTVATTRNFLQFSNQVGDYAGFYNRAQRNGIVRMPQGSQYYTFIRNFSVPEGKSEKVVANYEYGGTRGVISSTTDMSIQVILQSPKPLDGHDGSTGDPKSLLGIINTQVSIKGSLSYECKNILPISFRNTQAFSMRNIQIQLQTIDNDPIVFEGASVLTLGLIDSAPSVIVD